MKWKSFMRNAILLVMGGLAVIAAFGMTNKKSGSLFASPEVRLIAEEKIVELNGENIGRMIESRKGKPQLIFVYASWCPYCKRQFSTINRLHSTYQDTVAIDYISVDDDKYALADFLQRYYADLPFTPYHSALDNREAFIAALQQRGMKISGAIPYMAVLDNEGKLVREFEGLKDMQELTAVIDPLK